MTRRAAANDDAREETCRLVLRQRLAYERSRRVDRFVRADAVSSAARELGRLRSRRAIPLLIKCVIKLHGESRAACCNALVAVGQPALGPIAAAVSDPSSRPAWLSGYDIRPGSAARQLLVQTKDRIVQGAPSYIDDGGAELTVLVV